MITPTQPQPNEPQADAPPSPVSCTEPHDTRLRWRAPDAAWRLLRSTWYFVREVSGDDAYERYREHSLEAHPGQTPMSRSEYCRVRTEQKWDRVTRCC
jgi:uncharacterized short protein YbdD (DUF466 family)